MVEERLIQGVGTTEEEWLESAPLQALRSATLSTLIPENHRLVICAPHPDDEILPCGGLLAAASEAGRKILILALTDGEQSHPEHAELLSLARPHETTAALEELEVKAEVRRLRFNDGKLEMFEGAVADEVAAFLSASDVLLAPWKWDGHPDHEAASRAARTAAERNGSQILETMIWGWHWAAPNEERIPWSRGVRFPLGQKIHERKRRAIFKFATQIDSLIGEPILPPHVLSRFLRPWEVYWK